MNLHGIASPIVGAVNPLVPVAALISAGQSAPGPDGVVAPVYSSQVQLLGQVQPITWRDLQQLEGVNLGGVRWKIYLNGKVDAIVRAEKKGGDLIVIPTGQHPGTWLVAQVLEQYPDWVCAAIVFQNSSIPSGGVLMTDLTNPNNVVVVPLILTGV
jgi:hypothetical protein